ncbi:hypothetical protein [Luteimonas fraxinea]|uniref:hypothetical protein n=1 Tax=Luteimonas fraxinea TaxID=2901869 RepID=UPI001E51CCF3|nr:hypothetical protein [Luteimonas fraxinea]MCD9126169.1 hypothetical protein [Luteimonas fraxinea]
MMQDSQSSSGFFQQLECRLAVLSPPVNTGLKRNRFVLAAIGIGMLLALVPVGWLIGSEWAAWIKIVGVAMQACALSVLLFRQARDVIPDFIDAKRKFAVEMDGHFLQRARLLAWLRSCPRDQRVAYLAYIEARLEALQLHYPLIFGAVDKLGFLPVLVGVAIQLHAVDSVSVPVMVLGIWIVSLYGMALWMSGYRLQLEGYRRVMRSADDAVTKPFDVSA